MNKSLKCLFVVILLTITQFCGSCNACERHHGTSVRPREVSRSVQRDETNDQPVVQDASFNDFSGVGLPVIPDTISSQILYRKAYVTSYNQDTRIPNWVMWHLTAEHADGMVKRPGNAFHEDEEVSYPHVNNSDYRKSGWTRGHMCPCADNKWDPEAMYESFLYTNVCPQSAKNNTGLWNSIEISCRKWAKQYGDIYIVCGPVLFRRQHETIGESQVVVPEAFFKVILCLNGTPKGIGFICRNTDSGKKESYVNSISQVERITGYTFFPELTDAAVIEAKSQADLEQW